MCELQIVWNVDVCVVSLHVHFRWGVALVEEFNYWALLTPSWENNFQVLKVHPGMGHIRGLRGEEMARFSLILCFVKIWVEDPVLIICNKKKQIVN